MNAIKASSFKAVETLKKIMFEPLESRTLCSATLIHRLDAAFTFAQAQMTATLKTLPTNQFPSYTDARGRWVDVPASDWTSGYFTGELWESYARTHSSTTKKTATKLTSEVLPQAKATSDLAARLLPSVYLQYKLLPDVNALKVLITAAQTKVKTFNSTVGMFASAGQPKSSNANAQFTVLLDESTDVELIYRAASAAGRSDWIRKANSHLEKLQQTMIRPDGGTFQLGYYNPKTGEFVQGKAKQGYSDDSTWSRGQAWAMMSFTAAAELRGRADFLTTAKKLADYFIAHLPGDRVPYWDFNAPVTATKPRDSSSAAIAADALVWLAKLLPNEQGAKYRSAAEMILAALSSPAYLASGTTNVGVLQHGARWVAKGQSDSALVFGDYYFLDAINRYEGVI